MRVDEAVAEQDGADGMAHVATAVQNISARKVPVETTEELHCSSAADDYPTPHVNPTPVLVDKGSGVVSDATNDESYTFEAPEADDDFLNEDNSSNVQETQHAQTEEDIVTNNEPSLANNKDKENTTRDQVSNSNNFSHDDFELLKKLKGKYKADEIFSELNVSPREYKDCSVEDLHTIKRNIDIDDDDIILEVVLLELNTSCAKQSNRQGTQKE